MPLPHFTGVKSHNSNWEPVFKNLFEVEIFLPDEIKDKHPDASTLLLENAKSAKFPTYPALTEQTQKYKYSTRLYLGFPESTSVTDLAIEFNVNQNDSKQMFTFRMLKDWFDLAYNNEDGSTNYKKNVIGEIIVYQHDREGNIIRRVTYHNCQLKSFTGMEELSWDGTGDIMSLTGNWIADYFEDYYF